MKLTNREREIVDLIAQGLTNRQIGRRLHISEFTVKNHVRSVLSKLGTPTRTAVAVWAVRQTA